MIQEGLKAQVELIRQVFGYVNQFKGRTFVIKIDSELIDDPFFPALVQDLVLLKKMGIRIVLVPGAKSRIDQILTEYNIEWTLKGEIRITSPDSMPFIKMAAFDVANRIMTLLSESKADAVLGNWVKARGMGVIGGTDYQCAGQAANLKIDIIKSILDEGLIPIFPNIGWSTAGRPYNLSSNELAVYLSIQLKAEKLFFITAFEPDISAEFHKLPQYLIKSGELNGISQLKSHDAAEIGRLNQDSQGSLTTLLSLAAGACEAGVGRVHIVGGIQEGVVLKEIFSSRGLGLMVYHEEHTFIRPMAAADIPEVLRIMRPMVDKKLLVPRTPRVLEAKTADYVVYEVDGIIHACGALHLYNRTVGEIAAVCVDQTYSGLGLGKRIVEYLLSKALEKELSQIFVLTTRAEDWFTELGFRQGSVTDLPPEKLNDYDQSRASKPLFYDFGKGKE